MYAGNLGEGLRRAFILAILLPTLASAQTAADSPQSLYAAAVAACAAMPIRATGTTYYFCDCQQPEAQAECVAGDDDNAGTSPAAPKRTWTEAIAAFNAMNAGDTIALCKGGAWTVTSTSPVGCNENFTNPRCAAGSSLTDPANTSTCDIRDYTASWGGTAKPLLKASGAADIVTRHTGSTNGVRILNLAFQGTNLGPNGGVYANQNGIVAGLCNAIADSDWLVCNNDFSRLKLALQIANLGTMDNMVIRGNRFTMIDLDAFLGRANDLRIDANVFDNVGGFTHPVAGNWAHTIYLSSGNRPDLVSTNISIVNNQFFRTGSASTPPGPCATPTVVGHGQYQNVNIENNVVDNGPDSEPGCWGISIAAGGSEPTYFRNMRIHRNLVTTTGAAIVAGQSPGVVIENNVVRMTAPGTWKHGIYAPYDLARPQDDVQNGTVIRNNTIYITGTAGDNEAILVGTEGTGHVIANNAVYAEGGRCFSTPLASGAYAFVGNQSCFGGAAWGTTYDATTHVTADPLFENPPTSFVPQALSPLLGAGSAAQRPETDFAGLPRPTPPAIGAHEYQAEVPVEAEPTFDPPAGTYFGSQSVAMVCGAGATGCYTTNGSAPAAAVAGTCSAGTTYTAPITVANSLAVRGLCTKAGAANSSITSAAYVISARPTLSISNASVVEGNEGSVPARSR